MCVLMQGGVGWVGVVRFVAVIFIGSIYWRLCYSSWVYTLECLKWIEIEIDKSLERNEMRRRWEDDKDEKKNKQNKWIWYFANFVEIESRESFYRIRPRISTTQLYIHILNSIKPWYIIITSKNPATQTRCCICFIENKCHKYKMKNEKRKHSHILFSITQNKKST